MRCPGPRDDHRSNGAELWEGLVRRGLPRQEIEVPERAVATHVVRMPSSCRAGVNQSGRTTVLMGNHAGYVTYAARPDAGVSGTPPGKYVVTQNVEESRGSRVGYGIA